MQSFYSIIYCPIRPIVDEQLSIALFVRSKNKTYFRFSNDKLKIVKELIPSEAHSLLKSTLRNINEYILSKNQTELDFFQNPSTPTFSKIWKAEYFSYLNDYTNSLIHFSDPKPIDFDISETSFEKLYTKLVFEIDLKPSKKDVLAESIRSTIDSTIKENVNLDIELTSAQFKNLIVPTTVWFIGKNQKAVTGEVVDFSKPISFLETDIRNHLYLLQSIRESKEISKHGKHFIVGNEPSLEEKVKHSIWKEIKDLSYITYVNQSEATRITDYMKEHNVSPFFS